VGKDSKKLAFCKNGKNDSAKSLSAKVISANEPNSLKSNKITSRGAKLPLIGNLSYGWRSLAYMDVLASTDQG
jgi:hypothetical protein